MPGVGEHPGLLRDVRFDGLAALISEVDSSGWLGSPADLQGYHEILDAAATEVPVVPLRFGTILPSEDAVAQDLLAAHHDEFTAALDQVDGRTEFQVKSRYVKDAVLSEVLSQNEQAAGLREAIQGKDPDVTGNARIELGQLLNQAVRARREEDTRALGQIMADARTHPAPPQATVTGVMQPPVTTVEQNDHVAAAAYLMKRANATAPHRHPGADRPAGRHHHRRGRLARGRGRKEPERCPDL
jgi:hypothetical protein